MDVSMYPFVRQIVYNLNVNMPACTYAASARHLSKRDLHMLLICKRELGKVS